MDAVLKQLRLKKKTIQKALFIGGGFFLAGMAIEIMIAVKGVGTRGGGLGTVLGMQVMVLYLVGEGFTGLSESFGLTVGMGRTRKHFILGYYGMEFLLFLAAGLLFLGADFLEKEFLRILLPQMGFRDLLPGLQNPLGIAGASLILTAVSVYVGVLVLKYGSRVLWILYGIWMFAFFVLPKILHAGIENPYSMAGRVVLAAGRLIQLGTTVWIIIGIVSLILMVIYSVRELLRARVV